LRDRYTYELTEVGAESWLRKFEHGDKWSFCLKAKELKFLGWKGPKTDKHLVDQAA